MGPVTCGKGFAGLGSGARRKALFLEPIMDGIIKRVDEEKSQFGCYP